jgi:hypothetical protein
MQIMETPSLNISSRCGGRTGRGARITSESFAVLNLDRLIIKDNSALHVLSSLSTVYLTRHAAFIGKDDAQQHDWSNGIMNPPRGKTAP